MVSSQRFQDSDFDGPGRGPNSTATGPEAVERLIALLQELATYATHYLAARVDATRGRLRRMALAVAMLVAASMLVAVVLATCAVLLLLGLSQGVAAICGGPAWAGNLLVGGGLLAACVAATAAWCWRVNRTAQNATEDKSEQRKRAQRERFGRDANGPATTGPAK